MVAGVTLQVDGLRWREHLATVAAATPGLVPVIKGNGYGFGLELLAAEASRLGVDTVAVGTPAEVAAVRAAYGGDIVILHPWRTEDPLAVALVDDPSVITTVSRLDDLKQLADVGPLSGRVLVEVLTSMRRHGITVDDLDRVGPLLCRAALRGVDDPPAAAGRRPLRRGRAAGPGGSRGPAGPLWLSHLPSEETAALARQLGGASGDPAPVRLRLGTRLWLGTMQPPRTLRDRARRTSGAPGRTGRLPAAAGARRTAGSWWWPAARRTASGWRLRPPPHAPPAGDRAGHRFPGGGRLALSPYTIGGKKRWFLEPPHMQTSLVFLPGRRHPRRSVTDPGRAAADHRDRGPGSFRARRLRQGHGGRLVLRARKQPTPA